jgi:hypothetical protein
MRNRIILAAGVLVAALFLTAPAAEAHEPFWHRAYAPAYVPPVIVAPVPVVVRPPVFVAPPPVVVVRPVPVVVAPPWVVAPAPVVVAPALRPYVAPYVRYRNVYHHEHWDRHFHR